MNKLFELDDRVLVGLMESQMKEKDFRKKTMKKVRKKNNTKLWEELNEKHLKELGYIK